MSSRTKRVSSASALVLALLAAHACGGDPTGPQRAVVADVTIAPASLSLEMGETGTLSATTLDAAGHTLSGRTVAWTSSAPQVATVAGGVVTTVAPGSATITATSEGVEGRATAIVSVAFIVSPATQTIEVGDGWQMRAMRADTVLANVGWSTSNPSVATVSNAGFVTALAVGSATITATSTPATGSNRVRTATVAVVARSVQSVTIEPESWSMAVDATRQLAATARDRLGAPLGGHDVTWSSSDDAVATVSSTGLVTAKAEGTAVITATSEGKHASSTVTVTDPWVIDPAERTIAVGDGWQFLAVRNGIALSPVEWSSSDESVATVSSTGHVTAVAVGEATITAARAPNRTRTAHVTVTEQPVHTVTVEPSRATIAKGDTRQLAAVLKDHNQRVLTGRTVAWTSSDPDVASVSAGGLVTAKSAGSATITATSEEKSGSATVDVPPPDDVVASVTLTPHEAAIEVGATVGLTAAVKNAAGEIIAGKAASWSSLDPTVAEVSTDGRVIGRAPGTARIVASADGKADTASVTVSPAVIVRVVVSGGIPSLPAYNTGCPDGLSDDVKIALAYDARDVVISGRPITWAVGPMGVLTRTGGSVPANGVHITAISAGTGVVEATIDGVTGSTTVAVYNCGTLTVTPDPAAVTVGETVPLTATFRDLLGKPTVNPRGDWTTLDPTIATVSSGGVVRGVKAGTTTVFFRYLSLRASATVVVSDP